MSKQFLNGIDLVSNQIKRVAAGSADTDAANLGQVKALANGLDFKNSVRAASTTNVLISAPGAAIDGVTLAVGDRVLLRNQTAGAENGLYSFNGASSPLTRTADGAQGVLTSKATVVVEEGSVNAGLQFTLATTGTITVGTTALVFNQSGGGPSYSAGAGLSLNATQFSVDPTVVTRKFAQTIGDGSSSSITVTHNLGTKDVKVVVRDASTGEAYECDDFADTINTVRLVFGAAPAANALRAVVQG